MNKEQMLAEGIQILRALHELKKYNQFKSFVESLKRPENTSLIESITTGITTVMEALGGQFSGSYGVTPESTKISQDQLNRAATNKDALRELIFTQLIRYADVKSKTLDQAEAIFTKMVESNLADRLADKFDITKSTTPAAFVSYVQDHAFGALKSAAYDYAKSQKRGAGIGHISTSAPTGKDDSDRTTVGDTLSATDDISAESKYSFETILNTVKRLIKGKFKPEQEAYIIDRLRYESDPDSVELVQKEGESTLDALARKHGFKDNMAVAGNFWKKFTELVSRSANSSALSELKVKSGKNIDTTEKKSESDEDEIEVDDKEVDKLLAENEPDIETDETEEDEEPDYADVSDKFGGSGRFSNYDSYFERDDI